MIAQGTWWLKSKKDPRWNVYGKGDVGMLIKPSKCIEKRQELEKELGSPPDDLKYGYMKD